MKNYEINRNLLFDVMSIQSKSDGHDEMAISFINKFFKSNEKKLSLKIETDKYGNLYITKGQAEKYPCLACHIDTVHSIVDDYKVFVHDDVMFAFSAKSKSMVGIGGDDLSGVFIALNALLVSEVPIKAVFFRDEEVGCKGAADANMKFFDDCCYVIENDRRGNDDFIKEGAGVELCSKKFIDDLKDVLDHFKYKPTFGNITDVVTLKRRGLAVSSCNMSCGYYDPHSKTETISISDTQKAFNMTMSMIEVLGVNAYDHVYKEKVYNYSSSSTSTSSKKERGRGFQIKQGAINLDRGNVKPITGYYKEKISKQLSEDRLSSNYLKFVDIGIYKCPVCNVNKEYTFHIPTRTMVCKDCGKVSFLSVVPHLAKDLKFEYEDNGIKKVAVYSWLDDCFYDIGDCEYSETMLFYCLKSEYALFSEEE